MRMLKNIVLQLSSSVAALALATGVSTSDSACVFWFNQPEMPEAIEKFRK